MDECQGQKVDGRGQEIEGCSGKRKNEKKGMRGMVENGPKIETEP